MMDGVEVLNTIYEYGRLIHPMWCMIFILASLVIAILGLITVDCDIAQIILTGLIIITITGFVVSGFGAMIKTDEIINTKYEVIVSEDVNLVEFMKKYEILNTREYNVLDEEFEVLTVVEK